MFILIPAAITVLASYTANMLLEGSKSSIALTLSHQQHLKGLWETLNKEVHELKKTLDEIGPHIRQSTDWPSDWLDKLEQYRYEVEDIEQSMKHKRKKKLIRRFLVKTSVLVNQMQKFVTQMQETNTAGSTTNLVLTPQNRFPAGTFLRVEHKNNIIEELMKESKSHGVSIIGICGSGKTTLAEAIAEEARIRHHFPCILIPPQSSSFNSETVLDYIKKHLPSKDEKVLILLDDLPELDVDDWGPFNSVLGTLAGGSKFVITTQSSQVVSLTGTSKHFLHPLSGEEIIKLIHECANANRNLNEADDRAIRHNKEELVGTCKGLPLLANRVGRLLSAAQEGHRVTTIQKLTASSCWEVPDLARVLLKLKPVSLLEQQPHLKRCLAFCSLFPQDHDFKEDKLVRFWMAEGFSRQLPGSTMDANFVYNDTRQYFQDLHSSSIFQTSELPPWEEPSYKMHTLAYDLAQNVAPVSFYRRHIGNSNSIRSFKIPEFTHHFSLICENIGDDEKDEIALLFKSIEKDCRYLRTVLFYKDSGGKIPENSKFFRGLTRLRVLDLSHTKLTKLKPKDIEELKYLCYLDLSHTLIKKLPTLSKNPSLQVLKLKHCYRLVCLPTDFAKTMANLVFLHVNTRGLGIKPPFIGKLEKLRRLDVFTVGKEDGYKIAELTNLNGLEKSLCIAQLENVETKGEAQMAKLCNKEGLDRLELMWTESREEGEGNSLAKEVLEGLEPQKNLKELMIRNYYGSDFPQWLSIVCVLLQSIHLDGCRAVPDLTKLESLVKLEISNCRMLERLDEMLPASLQLLIIKGCGTLQDGLADRLQSRKINVEIVTSELLPAEVDEAVGHQSSSIQQGSRTLSSWLSNCVSRFLR